MKAADREVWEKPAWMEERPLGCLPLEDLLFFFQEEARERSALRVGERGRRRRFWDQEGRILLEVELPFRAENFGEGEWPLAGRDAYFLFRAGSAALGLCEGEPLVEHKCFQRYVVRGKGKAQPSHLKTKGKSRYGSRLRLQNSKRLIQESLERFRAWEEEDPLRRVFLSCPGRLFSELLSAQPPFPLAGDDPRLRRLPIHVHEPRLAELERVHAWASRGWLRLSDLALEDQDLVDRIEGLLRGQEL